MGLIDVKLHFVERESIIGFIMHRKPEMVTNPLGTPTMRPKDQMRMDRGRHFFFHRVDLARERELVENYEGELLANASATGLLDTNAQQIKTERVAKALKNAENHNRDEYLLVEIKKQIEHLEEVIGKKEGIGENPYINARSARKDLNTKRRYRNRLIGKGADLRQNLRHSNSKLFTREDPHTPIADR